MVKRMTKWRRANRIRAGWYRIRESHNRKKKLTDSRNLLTYEEYEEITKDDECFYCGGTLGLGGGLDRIDNSKSYTVENVLPCCGSCNRLRSDCLTVDETIVMIDTLRLMRKKKHVWDKD
jgi:hypothetical protein